MTVAPISGVIGMTVVRIASVSKEVHKICFFPQTIRDWNDLPDSLISDDEMSCCENMHMLYIHVILLKIYGGFATYLFATYTCLLPDLFTTNTFATCTFSLPDIFTTRVDKVRKGMKNTE